MRLILFLLLLVIHLQQEKSSQMLELNMSYVLIEMRKFLIKHAKNSQNSFIQLILMPILLFVKLLKMQKNILNQLKIFLSVRYINLSSSLSMMYIIQHNVVNSQLIQVHFRMLLQFHSLVRVYHLELKISKEGMLIFMILLS